MKSKFFFGFASLFFLLLAFPFKAFSETPIVIQITPATGPTIGGTPVVITGTGFTSKSAVTIGGNLAADITFVSNTELHATTPAGNKGARDVVVANFDGQAGRLVEGFMYEVQTVPLGEEFQVNTSRHIRTANPSVAMNSTGDFVVAWQDGSDIYAQRYASDGTPLGGQFSVNSIPTPDNTPVDTGIDAEGNFVICWVGKEALDYDVYARQYNSDGIPLDGEFRVNSFTKESQFNPLIGMYAVGNFVIVWTSGGEQDGSGFGIYAQRYSADGTPLGGEFRVNTFTEGDQEVRGVGTDATGNFIITWYSVIQVPHGLYARWYDVNGTPLGAEFYLDGGGGHLVGVDAVGNFVLAWEEIDGQGFRDIYARRYTSDGTPLGEKFRVNTTDFNEIDPSGGVDIAGNFVIAWTRDQPLQPVYPEIRAQRFAADDTPIGGEFLLFQGLEGAQSSDVTVNARGDFVIAGMGVSHDTLELGIYAQRYAGGVAPILSLTSITPNLGSISGGTPITITGTYFQPGATVTIGGVPTTDVTIVSEAEITATTPAVGEPGVYDVVVTNPDGQSATLPYGFTMVAPDTTPPTPNTIASIAAVSSTQMDITSTEATDDTPPVYYHLDGQYYDGAAWVDSGGGVSDYDYSTTRPNPWSDASLVENGWYRYRQQVKDSAEPPNESAWSDWVEKATLLNPPQDAEITFANVTETGMDVTVATPPKPSGAGSTGAYFDIITGEGQGSGAIDRGYADDYTAEYTLLNPNTQYGWKVKYRNRDGVETAYNPTEQKRYTLANTPSVPTVSNPTSTTLDVTINPNGNPDHTLFAIYNVTGGYYVNATGGNNGDTEVWQTESDWGTVTVVSLTPETTYEFKCKAKNGDSIETPLGPSGYGTTTAHPDTTPPEAVTDLATSNPTDTQITLTWTAPGDDGNVGTASQYDIRYSTSPIDDSNFSSATQVQDVPPPETAGSPESFVVTGLSPETTYYFAMKTADEAPNWSDLSNVAQGTTTAGVTVKLDPASKDISPGATANIDIIVENTPGVSGFEFKILYDSNVVSIKETTDVQLGSFLGSTGRSVFPLGPDIREDLDPAEVTFGAASLLGPKPLPTGDGTLASVVFTAVSVGSTTLDLTNVKLLDADAEKIPLSEGDGAITVEQIFYGDVSGNDEITAYDASLVLQYVVGLINLSQEQKEVADVTDDDTISALDAALILQYTVGLITSFPVAPALNPPNETRLLTEAIEQLESIYLTKEQKRVLEQLKHLVFSQLIPKHTALLQNYPNPFNPETWIPYELAKPAEVTIYIYNLKGQLIRALRLGGQLPGSYLTKDRAAYWNGMDNIGQKVSSGLYFYTITVDNLTTSKRMILLK